VDQRQTVGFDRRPGPAALETERDHEAEGRGPEIGPLRAGEAGRTAKPEQPQRGETDPEPDQGFRADPDAERGDGAGQKREPPVLRGERQAYGQAEQDQAQQQQQTVMVGPADAGVGEHARLGQQDQTGEQPGIAPERRCCRPAERGQRQRQEQGADQNAPEMQAGMKAEYGLEQPGPAEEQGVERAGPVLDVTLGRVDPEQAGIEPVAGRVQVQDPDQARVGVRVGERVVVNRHDVEPGEQDLHQHERAERQQDQPAKRHPVRRRRAD
jgi:hypothetical protein